VNGRKIAADSAKARLAAQQAKIDEQKALYQLKESQVDACTFARESMALLQLVPVDVGQRVTPENLPAWRTPRNSKQRSRSRNAGEGCGYRAKSDD